MKRPSANRNPWPRIDAWLEAHAPKVLAQLRRPVTPKVLATVEQALGAPLPSDLADAYRAHDGALSERPVLFSAMRAPREALWIRGMHWLPLAETQAQLRFMQEVDDEWPDELLPIASDGGGNLVLVDLADGVVTVYDHETAEYGPIAPSFGVWLSSLADDMDNELVALGTDGEADDDIDDELVLLKAPKPPPAKAPVLTEDRPARVFLALLAERKHALFAPDESPDELIAALTRALELRDARKRLRAVVKALEDNPYVEELFADDDELTALLEEFG